MSVIGAWFAGNKGVDFVACGCLKVPFFIFSKVPLHLHTFNQTAVGQFKSLLQKYLFT